MAVTVSADEASRTLPALIDRIGAVVRDTQ